MLLFEILFKFILIIPFPLSKAFATTVTLDNDVPLESVSKMLGHTKLTTMQIYAKTKDRKVNRDMITLKNRLKERNH